MRIGITLDEVLRDFLGQMGYSYDKYIDKCDINKIEFEDFDLLKYFPFENKEELHRFMYVEHSLEVFGHADQLYENLFTMVNMFLQQMEDEDEHDIILVTRGVSKSIPSTLFFLSKLAAQFRTIKFVTNYEDKWRGIDVLITANPLALKAKPEGRVAVKVNAPYNKDVAADFEMNSIMEFMTSEELRNKILN